MHLLKILLVLTVLIGLLGFTLRWYFSAAQVERREKNSRILGQYKRW